MDAAPQARSHRRPAGRAAGGRRGPLALAAVVAALGFVSFLMRVPCLTPHPTGLALAITGCHGDLEAMWYYRGLAEGNLPYLQPFLDPRSGQVVTVEYPVLTGLVMWLLSRVGTFTGFLGLSTLLMTAAAIAIAVALYRRSGRRAWLWAAAPALAHYLSYNYDALPSLAVLAALLLVLGTDPVSARPVRYLGAAALLGVGGALKLYPLLFVLPLALWLLYGRPGSGQRPVTSRLGRAAAACGVAAGVLVAANLPFAAANPAGWWLPFTFQAARPTDAASMSIWYFGITLWPSISQAQWIAASTAATAAGILVAAWGGWLAARRRGTFPLLATCLTTLIAYLLLNKVFSPQYLLWLLPLMVLADLSPRVVALYLGIDLVMFWSLGLVGYAFEVGPAGMLDRTLGVMLLTVLVRFGYLAWVALRVGRDSAGRARPVTG